MTRVLKILNLDFFRILWLRKALPLVCSALIFLGANSLPAQDLCGDFLCACGSGETAESCPSDCGECGDLVCDPYESQESCPSDCGPCGDLVCEGAENHANCPQDCPDLCGDLICDPGEIDCPQDCGEAIVACQVSGPGGEDPGPGHGPGGEKGDSGEDGVRDPWEGAKFGGGGGCSLRIPLP